MRFACVALLGAFLADEILARRATSLSSKFTTIKATCVDLIGSKKNGKKGNGKSPSFYTGAAKFRQTLEKESGASGDIKIWSFWEDFEANDDIIFCIYDSPDCETNTMPPIEIDVDENYNAETGITTIDVNVDRPGQDIRDYIDAKSLGLIIAGKGRVNCCNITEFDDSWDDPVNPTKTTSTGFIDQQTQTGFIEEESQTGFIDEQTETGFIDEETQTGFIDETTQTGFIDGHTQTGFIDEQTQTGFIDEQTQTGFIDEQTQTGFIEEEKATGFVEEEVSTGFLTQDGEEVARGELRPPGNEGDAEDVSSESDESMSDSETTDSETTVDDGDAGNTRLLFGQN